MTCSFKDSDVAFLVYLADHRIMTVDQLAIGRGERYEAVIKRLRRFEQRGWIVSMRRPNTGLRGRPQKLVALAPETLDVLRPRLQLPRAFPRELLTAASLTCIEHHLLVNDIRVRLTQMLREQHILNGCFIAPDTAAAYRHDPILLREQVALDGDEETFVPDGVFFLERTDTDPPKAVLFFIEVDMGTEPLVSRHDPARTISRKILRYQHLFHQRKYLRYERVWNRTFRGFRLLVVTSGHRRMGQIGRCLQETPNCDFIWLTHRRALLDGGPGAPIWHRGGAFQDPPRSILGGAVAASTERAG